MAPPLCLALFAALLVSSAAAVDWTWKSGRATVFGDDGKGSYCTPEQHDHSCWSINQGEDLKEPRRATLFNIELNLQPGHWAFLVQAIAALGIFSLTSRLAG